MAVSAETTPGELIGSESGTVTAFRVEKEGFGVKVESQFQGQ